MSDSFKAHEHIVFFDWEMLSGTSGTLVKESNVDNITLKLLLSIPQTHKKCYFHFNISFSSFLDLCPG